MNGPLMLVTHDAESDVYVLQIRAGEVTRAYESIRVG
jgi:hypothetical protein